MKFSTRSRYGLRAIVELAKSGQLSSISLDTIAKEQNISKRYLEQLFAILKRNGYIKSLRGAHGGYTLAKDPSDISAGEIIRVLEGSIAPVDCVSEENPKYCEMSENCSTKEVWEQVRDKINEAIDNIKLSDLI